MAKIPEKPQDIFEEFVSDFKNLYGDDLQAVILFGSGARGEYVKKRSDINFLIVLSEEGIQNLRKSLALIPKWHKRNVSTPLFLTLDYMASSLDTFPMEFLTMQQQYEVVYGTDVLGQLKIDKNHLRLQVEHEIKGKLLHLREEFLGTRGEKRLMSALISRSIPAFASLFAAMLFLKGEEIPDQRGVVIAKAAQVFGFKQEVFDKLLEVRDKRVSLSKEELSTLFDAYIWEIRKLADIVDKW